MVSILERNIRSLCHQKMVILKSICSEHEHSDIVDILSVYDGLNALLGIAHLAESGLSQAGENELLSIEAEMDRFFAAYRVMLVDVRQQDRSTTQTENAVDVRSTGRELKMKCRCVDVRQQGDKA